MFLLTFFSNFRLVFGKLWEAHSRLYPRQIYSRLKALDEIYKIYPPLHRSSLKNSTEFRQTFSYFCSLLRVRNVSALSVKKKENIRNKENKKTHAKLFGEMQLNFWFRRVAKVCTSCRSRQELSNNYLVSIWKNRLRYSRERASQTLANISQKLEKKLD